MLHIDLSYSIFNYILVCILSREGHQVWDRGGSVVLCCAASVVLVISLLCSLLGTDSQKHFRRLFEEDASTEPVCSYVVPSVH